jgi:hypothetical protein
MQFKSIANILILGLELVLVLVLGLEYMLFMSKPKVSKPGGN